MEDDIQALQKQLSFCRRIQIVSVTAHGNFVLAQGQLEDGVYENGASWFRVPLVPMDPQREETDHHDATAINQCDSMTSHDEHPTPPTSLNTITTETSAASCPLSDLCHIRITVGGLHQGQLSSLSDFRPDYSFTLGNAKDSKGILLTAQSQQLALHMIVHGWPSSHWGGISSRNLLMTSVATTGDKNNSPRSSNSNNNNPDEPMSEDQYLSVTLPLRYPDATVSFPSVYFFSDVNQGIIRNLPAAVRIKLEHGLEQSQAQFSFRKLVTNRLRFVMDEDDNEALNPQVQRVMEALAMLDIQSMEHLTTAQTKQTMEYIIQMHKIAKETGSDGTFDECVNGLLLQKQQKEERKRHQIKATL